jgi:LacI family transcriptional regulator
MKHQLAPTLKDVAREVASTVSAASVVLNGANSSARIAPSTRTRILEAAAPLHYRRNAVALGLSRRRMNIIGVAATVSGYATNYYFLALLSGILAAATERGQGVTVFSVPPGEPGAQTFQEFCDGRIDGLILVAPYVVDSLLAIVNRSTPIVAIHGSDPSLECNNVDVDNEGGGIWRHAISSISVTAISRILRGVFALGITV